MTEVAPPISGPQNEAQAEGRADQAEVARPFVRAGDVGDIGPGGGIGEAQQPHRLRRGHDDVVDRHHHERDQHHRPPPVAVGEVADDRAAEELHRGEGRR